MASGNTYAKKTKNKAPAPKPLEADEPELLIAVEEKAEADPIAAAEEESAELESEEAALDEEEVNPFGDKWEG